MGRYASKTLAQRVGRVSASLLLGLSGSLSQADSATVLVCDEDSGVEGPSLEAPYYAADGTPQRLLVAAGVVPPSGCQGMMLDGIATDQVRWVGPAEPHLDEEDLSSLILQGQFDGESVSVSEVISNRPLSPPPRSYLPFNQSVLSSFVPQPFGVEERVAMATPNELSCQPGERVAGVFYRSERRWLASSPMTLVVEARGHGDFDIAIGDSRRDDQQAPLTLGTLSLDGEPQTFHLPVPGNDRLWSSLTVICPTDQAEVHLQDLRMEPRERTADRARGAWFWSPDFWQERPQALWAAAQDQGLEELYVSVPVESGAVADPEPLREFLAEAHSRDLAVWVVIGDPRDVLEQSWPALRERLTALRRFNDQGEEDARLAGVQLDIEPYLLPGFAQNHDFWRERYVKTIDVAQEEINGAMPLDLVVPSWWGIHPRWGERLFEALDWSGARMTVMNYHTDPERLQHDAEPFLSWAENRGQRIRMALEAGSLADETQQRFVRAENEAGQLWLLPLAQDPVLVLLDAPHSGLVGTGFSHQGTVTIPASRYTFDGDLDRLSVVAAALESQWRRWSSFAGLSVHGLDEHPIEEGSE